MQGPLRKLQGTSVPRVYGTGSHADTVAPFYAMELLAEELSKHGSRLSLLHAETAAGMHAGGWALHSCPAWPACCIRVLSACMQSCHDRVRIDVTLTHTGGAVQCCLRQAKVLQICWPC